KLFSVSTRLSQWIRKPQRSGTTKAPRCIVLIASRKRSLAMIVRFNSTNRMHSYGLTRGSCSFYLVGQKKQSHVAPRPLRLIRKSQRTYLLWNRPVTYYCEAMKRKLNPDLVWDRLGQDSQFPYEEHRVILREPRIRGDTREVEIGPTEIV